jgi:extracellular elastinolytic metalloproteinase
MYTGYSAKRTACGVAAGAVLLVAGTVLAAAPTTTALSDGQTFDNRIEHNESFVIAQPSAQIAALKAVQNQVPDLSFTYDDRFGTTRTLSSNTTYLTAPSKGAPMDIALAYVRANLGVFGLSAADVAQFEVTDNVFAKVSGSTHIYLRQMANGIPVYNGQLQVNVNRDGRIMSVNNQFVPNLAAAATGVAPSITATQAMASAIESANIQLTSAPQALGAPEGPQQVTRFEQQGLSLEPVTAKLMYLPIRSGQVALVWNFEVWTLDGGHYYDFTVDAQSGEVWTQYDLMAHDAFKVYPSNLDGPQKARPLPPLDGRSLINNPANPVASPNGWFGDASFLTSGNNVNACADTDNNNQCDAGQPTCPAGICDFPVDFTQAPSASIPAAIANLFYMNNIIHDTQYQYGFDEAGGNFQNDNFGRGGAGNDAVFAQAQDGGGNCNANFGTPADGTGPGRMQMYTCTMGIPSRDGDFDNGVILHEYGHGISTRQVGGPAAPACLRNQQQAGEGWSDWLALVYTANAGDFDEQVRGVGAYLFNRDPSGTIRNLPYSTNNAVNPWTYESIAGASIPHGVGSRWTQGLWEVYWALTNKWGFEGDLQNFDVNDRREAGNKRALFYMNQGLKNTACNPTFINNRDGIIQAAMDNFGGEDVCTIWEAFAAFGLGTDAFSSGPNATRVRNGFRLPLACSRGRAQAPVCTNAVFATSFEDGAGGFSGATSTCRDGNFVSGTPLDVTFRGVKTQLTGTATGGARAFYTSPNPNSPGAGDVDGGTCEARTPLLPVGAGDVTVALNYYHGQLTSGGDAQDGFVVDVLDGDGTVLNTVVNIGDQQTNANWTEATQKFLVPANTQVQLRARATDGFASDDLIEAGIDDVLLCANPPAQTAGCAVFENFEGGAPEFVNDGASTCALASQFLVGTPTNNATGTGFQIEGSNQGLRSAFTGEFANVNTGTCTFGTGRSYAVTSPSTLSVAYWHGQGTVVDPAGDDGFALEYSVDGGSSWITLASGGDQTVRPAWSTVTAPVPAGSNVALRMRCTDGAGTNDNVECGIDDFSVCSSAQ